MTRNRIALPAAIAAATVCFMTACTSTSCSGRAQHEPAVEPHARPSGSIPGEEVEVSGSKKPPAVEPEAELARDDEAVSVAEAQATPSAAGPNRPRPRLQAPALMKRKAMGAVTQSLCIAPPSGPRTAHFNTEQYDRLYDNDFLRATDKPLSTFSIDVDAASYANVRRFLNSGRLPPEDAVRIEELINYFGYDYPQPTGDHPFSITTEMGVCPWDRDHRLVHLGLQGRTIDTESLPPSNLVFLLDVSGSMASPDKLPLLKTAVRMLVDNLRHDDRVAIVVYAGAAGLVLPSTPGDRKARILEAVERLSAGGSTAGGAGISLAYKVARNNFIRGGNNRVILATDGDFNVGVSSDGDLVRMIEERRKDGVFLTVLGFGTGNYKDAKMEKLADKGNGNYAYIDNVLEAKKVLVNEMGGTLLTIAKDVKVQVEFNPAKVRAYRLIGYVNRRLADRDFNDDTKDAGELGAGHTVTALYEIVPTDAETGIGPAVDELKYQTTSLRRETEVSGEVLTVKFRYKDPDGDTSKLIATALEDRIAHEPSIDYRFSAAVAGFGMLLRDSKYKGDLSWREVYEMAREARGEDPNGYRAELVSLVEKAEILSGAPGENARPYAVSN